MQRPLKERYREDASAARITLSASASEADVPVACSVDVARAVYEAQAHAGVGGPGAGACSGDLLLGALAACAQITAQMVAAAMGIPTNRIEVRAEGDMDLRGTLGIDREAPVGFDAIRLQLEVDAPDATEDQLRALEEKTEQYCVVLQTLVHPPGVWAKLVASSGRDTRSKE